MTKAKAKRATVGAKLAAKYASGDWGELERRDIARDIDRAVRRAFLHGRFALSCFSTGGDCKRCTKIAASYGVKL